MPIFEYTCKKDHKVTTVRKIAERDEPLKCKECNSEMKRVPSVNARPKVIGGTPIHYR